MRATLRRAAAPLSTIFELPSVDNFRAPAAVCDETGGGQPCRSSRRPPRCRASRCSTSRGSAPARPAFAQLADWGADVIRIEMPAAHRRRRRAGRSAPRVGLPEPAPQQAQPDAQPQGARGPRDPAAPRREGGRAGRELPPRRQGAARDRLRHAAARSTRAWSTPRSRASGRTGPTPSGRASTRSRRAWAA